MIQYISSLCAKISDPMETCQPRTFCYYRDSKNLLRSIHNNHLNKIRAKMHYEILCFIRQQNSVKWEKKIKISNI